MDKFNIIHILFIGITFLNLSCGNKNSHEYYNLGTEYLNKEEYQLALDSFKMCMESDSSFPNVMFLTGVCEYKLKNYHQALISLGKAIELNKRFIPAYIERAKLKIDLGDLSGALDDCQNAEQFDRNNSEIYKTKALAYEKQNMYPPAISNYEQAVKINNKDGGSYFNLGMLKIKTGKVSDGCDFLSRAGELGVMEAYVQIKLCCTGQASFKTNIILSDSIGIDSSQIIKVKIPAGWMKITLNQDSLEFHFPSNYKIVNNPNTNTPMYTATVGNSAFIFMVSPQPANCNGTINLMQCYNFFISGIIEGWKDGKLILKSNINYRGHQGVEYIFSVPSLSIKGNGRVFINNKTVIAFLYLAPNAFFKDTDFIALVNSLMFI